MTRKLAKKKVSRANRITSMLIGLVGIVLTIVLFNSSAREIFTTFQLKKELRLVESELESLETRQKELTLEKNKLEDPTYVQNYARGTHLLSKSEEQVFILPKGKR